MGSKMGQIDRIGDMQRRAAEQDDEQWMKDKAAGVVERWNAALASGRGALWSPTIRAAVMAGMPWLDVYCPGCQTNRAIDIRTVDRHPLASVGSLVIGLRCSWCPGSAPIARIKGLYRLPPTAERRHNV